MSESCVLAKPAFLPLCPIRLLYSVGFHLNTHFVGEAPELQEASGGQVINRSRRDIPEICCSFAQVCQYRSDALLIMRRWKDVTSHKAQLLLQLEGIAAHRRNVRSDYTSWFWLGNCCTSFAARIPYTIKVCAFQFYELGNWYGLGRIILTLSLYRLDLHPCQRTELQK